MIRIEIEIGKKERDKVVPNSYCTKFPAFPPRAITVFNRIHHYLKPRAEFIFSIVFQ